MRLRNLRLLVALALISAPALVAAQAEEGLDEEALDEEGSGESANVPARDEVPEPEPTSEVEELEQRLRDVEDRLDSVETASQLQRVRWGGDYRSLVTYSKYHGPDPSGARDMMGRPIIVDRKNKEQWLHRLRLSVEANPIKSVRFTGRLAMFKRFGANTATLFPQDFSETRIPRDSAMRLERAWLDWFITERLALSLGRISYTNGPPAELKENLEKPDATWGLHMVDGEYETVDLTAKISDRLLVRGFYASWAFPKNDDLFSEFLILNNGTENLRIIGGNLDLRTPELGDHFVQLGFYTVPKFRPFVVPFPLNQGPNPTNSPPPFDGTLVFPSSLPSSLGSYMNFSALMLWRDIGSMGLDLFGSAAIGILKPEPGAVGMYPLQDGMGGFVDAPILGLASADKCWQLSLMAPTPPPASCDSNSTLFIYAGARYKLPVKAMNFPKVGFEYNYGSRYWISFNQPGVDLTNKLANRGAAYEGYLIQPINDYLFLRLKALYIDSDYSGQFFGAIPLEFGGTSPEVERTVTVYSALLNAQF